MLANVTLFEHEHTSGFGCTERESAALERLNRAAGEEVLRPVLVGGHCELQAFQHVGIIRLGRRTVQVLPKMYHDRSGGQDPAVLVREATRNLLVLLSWAGRLPLRTYTLASVLRRELDWLEVLTRLFATHLKDQWRRGPPRAYQLVEEELPVLKGKWRLAEQARRPERKHQFAVAHDELQVDNALSRVFRFVVERLFHLTRDAGNRRALGALRQHLDGVRLLPLLTAADAGDDLLTRLHRRYAPLLRLARLFLDGGALQLAAGAVTTFAFTFDMNQLFEEFAVNTIRRYRDAVLPAALRCCALLPQARGAALHLARRGRAPAFRLRPDLLLRDCDQTYPLLLDTKYKRLAPAQANAGIRSDDFNQMFSYACRYHCPRVLLLYPQAAGDQPLRACFSLAEDGGSIEVATLDLRRDLTSMTGRQALREELRYLLAGSVLW